MEEGHNRGVAPAPFQIAHILLSETRDLGELLLREAFLPPQLPKIATHKLAHIHMRKLRLYIL